MSVLVFGVRSSREIKSTKSSRSTQPSVIIAAIHHVEATGNGNDLLAMIFLSDPLRATGISTDKLIHPDKTRADPQALALRSGPSCIGVCPRIP